MAPRARQSRTFNCVEASEKALAMLGPPRPRQHFWRERQHELAAARWTTIAVVGFRGFEAESFADRTRCEQRQACDGA